METNLVHWSYAAAGVGALAVYLGLPKGGRGPRGVAAVLGASALSGLLVILHHLAGPTANQVYFYALAFLAVGGAARVITHPRPVYAVLYFVMVVLATAGLAVLAGAEFLGAALVIVYAGAILVTYVFVIMLAQQSSAAAGSSAAFGAPGDPLGIGGAGEPGPPGDAQEYDARSREPIAAVLAGFVLTATIAGLLIGRQWTPIAASEADEPNTPAIGRVLLQDYAVSIELAGVLLMIAMVGAIVIAKKRIPLDAAEGEAYRPGEIGRRVGPF